MEEVREWNNPRHTARSSQSPPSPPNKVPKTHDFLLTDNLSVPPRSPLDTVRHWQHNTAAQTSASGREATREAMFDLCATDLLPQRPGRCEPRVLKRRPKPYQSMTRPRKDMVVSPSRNDRGRPKKSKNRPSKNAA